MTVAKRRNLAELPLPMAAADALDLLTGIVEREPSARLTLADGKVSIVVPGTRNGRGHVATTAPLLPLDGA